MFHQVCANPHDYDALLFGTTLLPSCANFGLWWIAKDNQREFRKEAVDSIKDNFYINDCLKSVSSENKAIVLVKEFCQLLSKGGFPWLNGSLTCEKLLSPSWGQDLWKMRNLICGQLRLWPIMVSSYIHPARWWSERTIPFYLGVGKEIQIFLLMVALVIWCT